MNERGDNVVDIDPSKVVEEGREEALNYLEGCIINLQVQLDMLKMLIKGMR